MEIQKTTPVQGISTENNHSSNYLARLPEGATFNAVVTGKQDNNSIILKLANGQLLQAKTLQMLEIGQTLKLEVIKSNPIPELKVVLPQATLSEQTVILQALRQFLPKQQSFSELANILKSTVLTADLTAINEAAHHVDTNLTSKEKLMSAEGLQQGIVNSGVFYETKVANGLSLQGDLKASLLALTDALQKAPDSDTNRALQTKTEGVIAHIVLDQLASLPKSNESQNIWQLSIPYKDGHHSETVSMKIKREAHNLSSNAPANWSITIELSPPELGKLQSKISFIDGRIDTHFWSDHLHIAHLIHSNLDLLAENYLAAGLIVGHLQALIGKHQNDLPSDTTESPRILDEHI